MTISAIAAKETLSVAGGCATPLGVILLILAAGQRPPVKATTLAALSDYYQTTLLQGVAGVLFVLVGLIALLAWLVVVALGGPPASVAPTGSRIHRDREHRS